MLGLGIGISLGNNRVAGSSGLDFTMVNDEFTTVTDIGDGEWLVQKTGGGNGWNASAVSTEPLLGDFILQFIPTAGIVGIGLDPTPLEDPHEINLAFAALFNSGTVYAGVNGSQSSISPFVMGETWFVKRTGTTISIGTGGTDGVTGYVEKGSYNVPGVLYVDSTIYYETNSFEIKRLA